MRWRKCGKDSALSARLPSASAPCRVAPNAARCGFLIQHNIQSQQVGRRRASRCRGRGARRMGMAGGNPYNMALDKNAANYTPLSPLSLIARTAYVYPDRIAVIHGATRLTCSAVYARCRRLGSALRQRGIGVGDTVAAMLPNIPAMYQAHFCVAMAGGVLNSLNTRLDAEAIAFMIDHGDAKVLLTDREFSATVAQALAKVKRKPLVIDVDDPAFS